MRFPFLFGGTLPLMEENEVAQDNGLEEWLWQLVLGDVDERDVAAKQLSRLRAEAMVRAHENGVERLSRDEPWGDYAVQVRSVVGAPGFDTRVLVLELTDFMDAAQTLRMSTWREEHARQDELSDRILARLTSGADEATRRKAMARLGKIICSTNDPKNKREQLQSKLLNQQVEANIVFSCLREELLSAPDRLRELMRRKHDVRRASEALSRLGSSAREFLPDLLAELDRAEVHRFQFVGPLASIARDDETTVRALVGRVELSPGSRAVNALQVLRALGPRVVELVPEVFPVLLGALEHAESRIAAVYALGTIGSNSDEWGERIALRVLELSRTNDVWLKGATLWAMGDLGQRADLVVPRLIEAFDDYEEPDPDYCYGSSHTFVTDALTQFGPRAAPAVPALLARLRTEDSELDGGILKALAAIGPPAGFEAQERLETLAREWAKEHEIEVEDVIGDEDSSIGQTRRAIRAS